MDKFYQACFTRVGGTDRTSGWQLTNTSEDTPGRLLSVFEQRQKGNEPVGRGMPRNRDREPLCALEISCEADVVGLTRIQYGVPCYGREGLFSHGFLFPNAYELLKEPNRILAVDDVNFCFHTDIRPDSAEALQSYLDRTANLPAELIRGPGWTVDSALARTGMKRNAYKELICCLYGSWGKSAKNAVCIKTDGTDEYVRAMLYLIYAALPYSMRPKVTASTFPDARNTTLILTHELPDGCRYFDPSNGMNNVLTANQRKRWNRMPFVTMAFADGVPPYDVLEEKLAQMEDRYSQDTTMLQIACQMGLGGGDADPVDELYDFLNIPRDYNDMMERWAAEKVAAVSNIITAQGIELSSDMEKMLEQRLEAAQSKALRDACRNFKLARLKPMQLDDACRNLRDSPAFFKEVRNDLGQMGWGQRLLENYYSEEIAPVVDDPECSYKQLLECAGQFSDLVGMSNLWEMVFGAAKRRAEEQARTAVEQKMFIASGNHSPLYYVLADYNQFSWEIKKLSKIPAAERTEIDKRIDQDLKTVTERWLREYDQRFRQSFDPDRIDEYEQFYKEFSKISFLRYSTMLLQKYMAASTGMIDVLLDFIEGGCLFNTYNSDGAGIQKRTQLKPENVYEQKLIEQSLYSYWADTEAVRKNIWMQDEINRLENKPGKKNKQDFREKDTKSFLFWERAARNRKLNMIWLMLEKGSVLLTNEMLVRSLAENDRYWTDDCLNSVISQCEACVQNGKDGAKPVLEVLKKERECRDEQLEANRKQAEKDKKGRDKGTKRTATQEKQTVKSEPEEDSGKAEKPEKPPKPAEPKYEPFTKPAEKPAAAPQPGVPNKFTEEPQGWDVPGLGKIPVVPKEKKPADVDDTDSVLEFLTPEYAVPQVPEQPASPVNPEDSVKVVPEGPKEEQKKGGLRGFFKKFRS